GGGAAGSGGAGGEDPAVHREQVRGENHLDRLARDVGEGLLDLRGVAVAADVVGGDTLVALGEVRGELGRAARAGDAALAIDDEVAQADVLARDEGGEGEDGPLRVA